MSHYLFISVVEPVLTASSANEHFFDVDVTCRLVMRGWMLRAQIVIAIGSPCVVLSTQRQDLSTASGKLMIVSTS